MQEKLSNEMKEQHAPAVIPHPQNFHLTNLRVSVILAIKFKQVHAVNERKSEVRSLREPVDGENRCDVSVIYHS